MKLLLILVLLLTGCTGGEGAGALSNSGDSDISGGSGGSGGGGGGGGGGSSTVNIDMVGRRGTGCQEPATAVVPTTGTINLQATIELAHASPSSSPQEHISVVVGATRFCYQRINMNLLNRYFLIGTKTTPCNDGAAFDNALSHDVPVTAGDALEITFHSATLPPCTPLELSLQLTIP